MNNWWIKFGCFLTGYKYAILSGCSEVAQRAVKRYTSALLIICILWAFIGYSFVDKYLKSAWYMSIIGAVLFIVIILQVERQIIMSEGNGKAKYWIRGAIAGIMAIIGSIIIDQIIFREDVAHRALFELNEQVATLMPAKEAVLKHQIFQLDSSISKKEAERMNLLADLSAHPTIQISTQSNGTSPTNTTTTDSSGRVQSRIKIVRTKTTTTTSIDNPKRAMLAPLDQQLKELRDNKIEQENRLIKLRSEVEKDAKANTGFLFELQLMYQILRDSGPAFVVWLLWFLLLFGIEIFIMVNKLTHLETDYDVCILHHMELQKRKLRLIAKPQTAGEAVYP